MGSGGGGEGVGLRETMWGGEIEIMECRDSRKFSRDVMPYSPPSVAVSSFKVELSPSFSIFLFTSCVIVYFP